MAIEGRRIAVVGAGVGGLAAALALAQRRADVTVYEAAPALTEIGAGVQIGPNGVAVLEALGLRDAAETVASLPQAIELRDGPTGRPVARLPLGPACVARYGRPYWQLHRADLLGVLARGAADAGVALRLGSPVAGVAETPHGVRLDLGEGRGRAGRRRDRRGRPALGAAPVGVRRRVAALHRSRRVARRSSRPTACRRGCSRTRPA